MGSILDPQACSRLKNKLCYVVHFNMFMSLHFAMSVSLFCKEALDVHIFFASFLLVKGSFFNMLLHVVMSVCFGTNTDVYKSFIQLYNTCSCSKYA